MEQEKNQTSESLQDQDPNESDKPPLTSPRLARPWRVAVIANVKGESALTFDGPEDANAEFDKPETIQAIQDAIESDGHTTVFLPADANLPFSVREFCPDICFNIAEGMGGDAREAHVPALLEMMHIPYTASRVLANALGLDKTMTKHIWHQAGLPTATFQEFVIGDEPLNSDIEFPMFVKPSREGTGMGMGSESIVHNEDELRARVMWVINKYKQPALVETYLPGREFTVAVMGRRDSAQFVRRPELYEADGYHRFELLEVDSSSAVTPGVYGYLTKTLHFGDEGIPGFICPTQVEPDLAQQMQTLAIRAHQAIGALDISRVDMRLDAQGQPRLIEINTLPGLTPNFSDLCVIANAEGLSYNDLILEILYLGASRYGLLTPRNQLSFEPIRVSQWQPVVRTSGV